MLVLYCVLLIGKCATWRENNELFVELEELAFGLQEKIQEVETFLEEVFKCRDPSRPFTLFVATWNIGNRAPSLNDLVRKLSKG